MSVDPQIGALLAQAEGAPSISTMEPAEARDLLRNLFAGIAMNEAIDGVSVESAEIPGAEGPREGRIYRPAGDGPRPILFFIHGGGFTIGDLDGYDFQCRLLCRDADCVVVTMDYRLAPEGRFPAGLEDCVAGLRWTFENVSELGGDPDRIAIGGDSAGGNFSAVIAQQWQGEEGELVAQLLLYPTTNMTHTVDAMPASVEENAEGYFLTLEDMLWFQGHYVGVDADPSDVRLSPALAEDLSGLPPAVVATAGYDPLRDDGEAYAQALAEAGVEVVDLRFDSMIHGFFAMGPISSGARSASAEVIGAFRDLIHA